MKPIRIAYFIGDLGPGGSEGHLAQLVLRLDRERFRPELVLMRAEGSRLDQVRAAGVPIHDIASRDGMHGRIERIVRIHSCFRRLRVDIVHAYGFPCDVYASVLSFPRRGALVVTARRGNQTLAWKRRCYRFTNFLVDRVLSVSSATERFSMETEGLAARRSVVITNGVDVDAFHPRSNYSARITTIGTLGRIEEDKGQDLLLEAFSRLRRDEMVLKVGGLPDTPWGESLYAGAQNRPGIVLVGEIRDVPSFFASLDLFVLPSRTEGMSNALLEAMAAGLPIVATDVGSNREVLGDGDAGLLVGPSEGSIAEGIAALIDDPVRAASLGRKARQRVESEYRLSEMVKRYEDLYEDLVAQRPSRPAKRTA